MNRRNKNVVVVFAKKPEMGKVKTRIAQETSEKFAYEFTIASLFDLINKIKDSNYYDLVIGVDSPTDLLWFQNNFSLDGMIIKNIKKGVGKTTISDKFEHIFSGLLSKNSHNYNKAILIPMDIPFIRAEDLISAFARLDQKKFVHGPELNGGVYLIGVRTPYRKGIFKKVRWSTSHSFEDLVRNCGKESTFILKMKSDLNVPEDIIQLKNEISHSCPILHKFLEENSYYLPTENQYINFDDLSMCIPVVSNIVEKKNKNSQIKILIQTRHKPLVDPKNTGKIEIPSGLIGKYELAHDAAVRETKEETGLITEISKEQRATSEARSSKNEDVVVGYRPFYCQQQIKGGRSYLSVAFISRYISGELKESFRENRNPRWVSLKNIQRIINDNPNKIFPLSLVVLQEYLKYRNIK